MVNNMEYLRTTIDSSVLTPIINLPYSLRNKNVEIIVLPVEKTVNITKRKSLKGCLNKYANPDLLALEKDAWKKALEEKHANN